MTLFKKKPQLVKNTEQKKSTPKSNNMGADVGGKKLSAWIYQPALIALVSMFIGYLLIEYMYFEDLEREQSQRVKSLISSSIKLNVNSYINDKVTGLKSYAKTEMVQDSMLSSEDSLRMSDVASVMWADLESLVVLDKASISSVKDTYPDLSFASVDLLRRVLAGKDEGAESFYHGGNWYFQVSVPVEFSSHSENARNSGVVLAIFNTNSIKSLLAIPNNLPSGEVALVSSQGKKGKTIVSLGKGNTKHAKLEQTVISEWRVRYSPESDEMSEYDRSSLWLVLGVVCLLLVGALPIVCRVNLNKVRRDMVLANQAVMRAASGEGKIPSSFVYAESYSMVQSIVLQVRKVIQDAEAKARRVDVEGGAALTDKLKNVEDSDAPLFDDDLLDLDVLSESNGSAEMEMITKSNNESDEMVKEIEGLDFDVPQSIFRAYDIRGIVNETLNEGIVELLGKSIASEAISLGQKALCVGYDGRLSSVAYCEALTRGIISTGLDAIIIGQVPTPVLYFSTHHFETGSGVMITGSHNPSNYNGFKMMIDGNTLSGDDIQKLYNRIILQDFSEGQGVRTEESVDRIYQDTILNDIAVAAPLKVVLDAGNGVAGGIAPELIEELGCEVIPLFCEVDGNFPNHHPDPGKPENLQDLIAAVKEHDADIGLAFDGDGDRLGVVTNEGKIIWPDRLLMLFAKDVVSRNPGADIIFDVKCSRRINGLITSYGGRPIMWKTGHSLIKAKMKETGALLAGEMSGHVFFKERWYGFDDGLYSAARLLEILGIEDKTSDEVFACFPEDISTPEINITVTDESKFEIVEKLCGRKDQFEGGNVSTIDGLRVDYPNGWGLCRASNTTPVLVLRFEADDELALEEIKAKFVTQLKSIDSSLACDF